MNQKTETHGPYLWVVFTSKNVPPYRLLVNECKPMLCYKHHKKVSAIKKKV